jgi:hypothetical protein
MAINAYVPGTDLQTTGKATVTVSSPTPGGGTSNALTFAITSTPTSGATVVNVVANDLAWDAVNQTIYLSLPSSDGSNGNSVQGFDPTTANLGTPVLVGKEPYLLSVSANSQYLYVGLNGDNSVQRLTLPKLGTDITIPLGSDPVYGSFHAEDLQAAPNGDGTVAIVRGISSGSPREEGGMVIYDNQTARPNALCGFIQPGCTGSGDLYDTIQWNGDGSEMFAADNESTGASLYTVPVDSSGFSKVTVYPGVFGTHTVPATSQLIHYDKTTGYVYGDDGNVIDPASGTLVGSFPSSGPMVPDGNLNMAFFVSQMPNDVGSSTYTLESFDLQHFTLIRALTLQNINGIPTHLIRWGSNGLAFVANSNASNTNPPDAASGAVYIISGSFIDGTSDDRVAKSY